MIMVYIYLLLAQETQPSLDILVRQLWGVRISDLYAYRTETKDEEPDYDFNNDAWYDQAVAVLCSRSDHGDGPEDAISCFTLMLFHFMFSLVGLYRSAYRSKPE